MGFPDPKYDETEYAQMVADQYGTDHYREVVELEAVGLVERLAQAYGEPFADPSALPTYRVSKLARSQVTVALSGDGGDEAFAGYRRYPFHMREEAVKARIPASLRRLIFGPLAWAYPRAAWAPRMFRAKATFEALSRDRAAGYFRAITVLPDELRARLFSGDLHQSLDGYDPVSVIRGFAGGRRHGQSAQDRAVCRHENLARRPDAGEGGSRRHGQFAGGAAAAARPQPGAMGHRPARPAQGQRFRGQVDPEEGAGAVAAARPALPHQAGLFHATCRLAARRARPADRDADRFTGGAGQLRPVRHGFSSAGLPPITMPGGRTTPRCCGR